MQKTEAEIQELQIKIANNVEKTERVESRISRIDQLKLELADLIIELHSTNENRPDIDAQIERIGDEIAAIEREGEDDE